MGKAKKQRTKDNVKKQKSRPYIKRTYEGRPFGGYVSNGPPTHGQVEQMVPLELNELPTNT